MQTRVQFSFNKETKNYVRFDEEVPERQLPVFVNGNIYVDKFQFQGSIPSEVSVYIEWNN